MKHYENFDNTFFLKIICIIAGIALVFVIAAAAVGIITRDASPADKSKDAETFVFGETNTPADSTVTPIDTEADTEDPEPVESDTEPDTEAPGSDTEGAPEDTESIPEESDSEQITEPEEPITTVLGETEDMGQEYINSLIFLGDSTTNGLRAYKMLKDGKNTNQVWTTKTATLSLSDILTKKIVYPNTGKEMTIAEAAELAKPEYLVITLGLEGVTFLDEDEFKEQYTSLVEAVKAASPETKIMLQSIFPVASSFKNTDKLNNPLIDKANVWVLSVAESTGVRFLDTQSVMKDENGALIAGYDNGGNGINLKETGFTAVLNYIRTHGYK